MDRTAIRAARAFITKWRPMVFRCSLCFCPEIKTSAEVVLPVCSSFSTCASELAAPNQTASHPYFAASYRSTPAVSISALRTAIPSACSPLINPAFSPAISETLLKASRWASATVVTTATSGRASCARGAISPGWFMPISTTAKSTSRAIRASVSGTPQWLL